MDSEPLIISHIHQDEEEVYMQTSKQVIMTNTEVTLVAPVWKTGITERGSVGDGKHEVEEEDCASFNPSDSSKYMRNGQAIGIAMSPTEEVPEVYLKNMFTMPPNHEVYCPNCQVCINKVFFCTTRQQIVPLVTNPPLEPQVIEHDKDGVECLVQCSTCFCFLTLKGKQFITGSVSTVPEEIGIVIEMNEHDKERQELYLERVYQKPPTHEFYCPNCESCIQKVIIHKYEFERGNAPTEQMRCLPCFSFFIPMACLSCFSCFIPIAGLSAKSYGDAIPHDKDEVECIVRCVTLFLSLIGKGKKFIKGLVSRVPEESRPRELSKTVSDLATTKPPPIITTTESNKGWEVLKSIVYGGLAESLASLSVVTSAASADAATLSILTLGTANLIGGLTILTYNLRDLKASQPREEESEREAKVERYYELLGKRENFFIHVFFAILSLLIFGLVPPIVYGFSFRESDDKDLKLAAVAGASLICITLLAIAKAQTQRPNNTFMTFFKTVTFYVTSGVLASLLTYVAGTQMKKLVEQLGWFQPKSNFGLSLPHVSV